MTPRIEKAIDILLDALNAGTLRKGSCRACAVGNLVTAGMRRPVFVQADGSPPWGVHNYMWPRLFYTSGKEQVHHPHMEDNELVREEVESTGFTASELMAIEYAFECNTRLFSNQWHIDPSKAATIRRNQVRGLEAVVKAMLKFEQDTVTDVEEVFTKKAKATSNAVMAPC